MTAADAQSTKKAGSTQRALAGFRWTVFAPRRAADYPLALPLAMADSSSHAPLGAPNFASAAASLLHSHYTLLNLDAICA